MISSPGSIPMAPKHAWRPVVQEFTEIYQVKTQDIIYKNIHRWRYAKVKKPFPQEENKISKKIPFGIAGD